MKIIFLLGLLIKHLPKVLELISRIEQGIKEAGVQRKVGEDLKVINEAFKTKDMDRLKRLVNDD